MAVCKKCGTKFKLVSSPNYNDSYSWRAWIKNNRESRMAGIDLIFCWECWKEKEKRLILKYTLRNKKCPKCKKLSDTFFSIDSKFDDCHDRLYVRILRHYNREHRYENKETEEVSKVQT